MLSPLLLSLIEHTSSLPCCQANKHLAEENEELTAQLLADAVRKGRDMLQEGNSLAEELEHMTKEEVRDGLVFSLLLQAFYSVYLNLSY